VSPAGIKVRVSNDSGVPGLAKQAADAMRVQGFSITSFVTGTGTPTYSHTDGLGSVRALTDSTGAVVQTYQSDEFGVPIASGTQG